MATKYYDDFTFHNWSIGESITQDKMLRIEKGIESAFAIANGKASNSDLTSLSNTVTNTLAGFSNEINGAKAKALQALDATANGDNAWTLISGVTAGGSKSLATVLSELLGDALSYTDTAIDTVNSTVSDIDGRVTVVETSASNSTNAITVIQNILDGIKGNADDSAAARINRMDSTISANQQAINTLSTGGRGSYNSLAERLDAIDNSTTGFRTLPAVDTEVVNARGKDANNNAYLNLSLRLNASDTALATVKGTADGAIQATKIINDTLDSVDGTAVLGGQTGGVIKTAIANAKQEAITLANGYADNKVPKTAIADNYDGAADTVLSGAKGKDLNDRLSTAEGKLSAALVSSAIRTNDLPTTFTSIDARLENVEGIAVAVQDEIEDAHRTDLGLDEETGLPIQDTLKDRFEAIESAQSSNNTSLSNRITALETEVDMTSANSRIDNVETEVTNARTSSIITDEHTEEVGGETVTTQVPHTYASVDARLEAIEAHAAAVRTDVDTIAGELSMVDTNGLTTIGTRVDDIEYDISHTATLEDNTTGLTLHITAIETEIGDAHRANINNDTLDNRFDSIEHDISHPVVEADPEHDIIADAGGLTERLTAVETSITGADGINDRLDALDTPTTGAIALLQAEDTAQDGRITAIETELTNARIQLDGQVVNGEPVYSTLDDRFDLIEHDISHEASGNDAGGLTERLAAAESALTTKANNSDLSSKANTTDVSLTVIKQKNEVTYTTNANNETVPSGTLSWTIVERNDYLLLNSTDDKYYYWKYIGTAPNGSWHLISGAGGGGSGNTSGMDVTRAQYTALASTTGYAENTDYYVTEESGLVRHYRYVTLNDTLTEIEIGPLVSNLKKYNISSGIQTVKVEGVDTDVTYLYLHEFAYGEDNSEPDQSTIITSIPLPAGGGAAISTQKMVRITERNIVQPLGAVTPVELKFFYTSGIENESGVGQLYIDDIAVGDEFTVTSGDPTKASSTWPTVTQENPLPKGFYSIDISQYCTELGTLQFRIKISDPDDTTGTMWKDLKWDVNVMNLTISSTFTEHSVNALNSTVKFIYTANGDIDKVANFKLGNTTLPSVNLSRNTSGIPQEYNISMPLAGAGAYKLEVWLTATANGHALPPSQSLYRDIIWYDSTSSDIIISSPYRGNVEEPITQYDVVEIPYTIVGGTSPYTVKYYVDDMSTPIDEVTLSSNSGIWEYNANSKNIHTLKIECQSASITFSFKVAELKTDIAPVTTGLVLDFNPQGITNTSAKRLWSNDNYHMTVSNNFDWYNGGYGSDEDGDYFLVKAGSRAIFDYKMFRATEDENHNVLNEVFENGKEFKIIFKTNAVRSADAIWFTNMGASSSNENAKLVGIQLSAHNGFLKTNAASDTAVGSDDDEVAATNTYLYFSYSEEDKIELDININQKSETSQFIMSYEDGCPSKAYPYKTSEILYHFEDATHEASDIVIGSDDCDVYIYRMRIYDMELNTELVLRNFIADGKNSTESIKRYNRNCIYYDTNEKVFVPYAGNNTVLDPVRLATKIPDIKVLMLETPQFTKNKKDFIPYSSLRCIHAPGGKVFPSRGKEDNWLFQNGYHVGQGTTSDKYGNAGRNLDFLFMCDGIHNPSDKVSVKKENFLPGYQSSLILGYGTDEQEAPKYCLDWKDEDTWRANKAYELTDNGHDTLVRYNGEVYKCIEAHTSTSEFDATKWALQEGYTSKITLKNDSIPNNFFNLKVNIASSENANNALLQKRYNDFLPYTSPAKLRDNRIKNDMEFVPAIIFVRETGSAVVDGQTVTYERREFNDDQCHFYELGNIGDSKKTDYTRAYDPQDMNEFTLEISDNNTNNSQFQSGIYMASFYRPVAEPVIDNIADYYVAGNTIGTVEVAIPNSAETETQYYGNFTKTLDAEITQGTTYYTFIEKRRFVEPYTLELDMDEGEPIEGSFTAMSAAGEGIQEIDYLFPIDYDTEWAAVDGEGRPINMRYWALFNEGFDGDHSFEMRYACKGDYRDGKVVNDTTGQAKAQLKLNEKVWREFYTWLITSTDEQFVNELEQWCVKASVDFFYAFTHYYTMMDNRAKNTFWHFAKTGKHRKVTRPVKALLHIYEEADGTVTPNEQNPSVFEGNFVPTSDVAVINPYFVDEYTLVQASKFSNGITYYTYNNNQYTIAEVTPGNDIPDNIAYYTHAYVLTNDTTILENTTYYQLVNNVYTVATVTVGDPIKQYYTQYAFDMWVYDTDTALGIDNNGELVFPYGKEDTDYRIANDPSSSNVFNGAGSVFWRRLRDNCKDDIRSIFTSVRSECFNANTLIQEFDLWQECYPEAIWRLDVERKYIRSYTGDTGPNGAYLTRKETRFLRDMMLGRKRYQRRQWSKDQDIYFGSKYMLPSVSDDFFEFSCYNPGGMAVTPNWDLTITPYQDMYINISYAETFANPVRVKAGVAYEFKSILNTMNDSRIRVFGANHIQALAGKAKREDPNDPEKITGAEGLASFYIKANNFENGKKLRKLILGTDNPNYLNGNFTTLNIANDYPILEEFSIKNCNNLGGLLDFSKSTALKVIDAQGTKITQVLLPGSTGILALHLPETTLAIELRSAKQLTDLTINNRQGTQDLSNLARLDVNDSDYSNNINWMSIALNTLSHLDLLSILGMRTSSIGNIDELEAFKARKATINRVYLGGNLTVTGAWSSIEKETYEGIWSDNQLNLLVDELQEVTRYKVTFKLPNDVLNGKELYSMYVTPEPGVATATLDSDPAYTGLIPSSELVKPSTVATEYIFGKRNAYGYIAWTGWRKENSANPVGNDTTIDDDTVLIAVFEAKTRSYPIKWYLHENDASSLVRTTNAVAYGSSYNGVAPTVYDLKEANKTTAILNAASGSTVCSYKIFKGWKRLPINLDDTFINNDAFCIYGDWEEENNVSISTILADATLTPRKLLVLSNLNDNLTLGNDLIETGDILDVTMGYDSIESGTLLIGEGAQYVMNDARTYNPTVAFSGVGNPAPFASNIKPFSGDDGFTLAIDYKFDTTAITNANWPNGWSVLAGCHEKVNNVAQGFSLYYDILYNSVNVCFGDLSQENTFSAERSYHCEIANDSNSNMRNIIVIRHPAGENYIQVYSGLRSGSNILNGLDNAGFVQTLTYSSNSSDAKLCFGNVINGTAPFAKLRQGLGTIYWVKYWDHDLGRSECTQLASWIHEKMRFAVEEYPNMDESVTVADEKILNTTSKNIIFTALQTSLYGGPSYDPDTQASTIGEVKSWVGSLYKDISNKRFLLGLPILIQSIINKTTGKASSVQCESGDWNSYYGYLSALDTTDYCFLPSYPEVMGIVGEYYEDEAFRGMPWLSSGNTQVFNYTGTSFSTTASQNVKYMNLRFPGVPINLGTGANTVYTGYTGSSSVYDVIIIDHTIKRGDIFIYNNVAYIYATDEDIRNGAPVINASSGVYACPTGGWIRAQTWWTRSVSPKNPVNHNNSFYYINDYSGDINNNKPTNANLSIGCWFIYSFGI